MKKFLGSGKEDYLKSISAKKKSVEKGVGPGRTWRPKREKKKKRRKRDRGILRKKGSRLCPPVNTWEWSKKLLRQKREIP